MRRRKFILFLGGVLAAWPLAAHPEQNAVKRVGILAPFNKNDPESQVNLAAFRNGSLSLAGLKVEMLQLTIGLRAGTPN